MRKNWLRGVLLGVSMALLLAGGVALAADVYIKADPTCFECWEMPFRGTAGIMPPEGKQVTLEIGGWDAQAGVCWQISDPVDESWHMRCTDGATWDSPCQISFWVYCEGLLGDWRSNCLIDGMAPANNIPSHYGTWLAQVYTLPNEEPQSSAKVSILFAEDCAAAGYVPEPGSILLLGSGLAGLAGYGALRWRTRE